MATERSSNGYLSGQLLIAMPQMLDPRFQRTVIYMCAHSAEGAMGLVINKPMRVALLPRPPAAARDRARAGRGLHADLFRRAGGDRARLRAAFGRLCGRGHAGGRRQCRADRQHRHRARHRDGCGPNRRLLALGYAGWGPGQLDRRSSRTAGSACRPTTSSCSGPIDGSKWERGDGQARRRHRKAIRLRRPRVTARAWTRSGFPAIAVVHRTKP